MVCLGYVWMEGFGKEKKGRTRAIYVWLQGFGKEKEGRTKAIYFESHFLLPNGQYFSQVFIGNSKINVKTICVIKASLNEFVTITRLHQDAL